MSITSAPRPYTLIAELTYSCPLRCAYCSNPVDFRAHDAVLDTGDWCRLLEEAEALGVVQLNLTGGEPLLRPDLEAIVERASELELFSNLITSAVPLSRERLRGLKQRGLGSIQISFQGSDRDQARSIAGSDVFEAKRRAALWAKELGLALTLNVVLHAKNIDRTADFVRLAEELSAERIELANVQYLGWALLNRSALMPSSAQIDRAREIAVQAARRLLGQSEVLFVLPDHHAGRPRACMDGWGRRYIVVTPDGFVAPCHAARTIPGISLESALGRSLAEIWRDSTSFNAFRGESWMREPCRSCERRRVDFGGCRCQAYLLTGDARATDPACALAHDHASIESLRVRGVTRPAEPIVLRSRHARARCADEHALLTPRSGCAR